METLLTNWEFLILINLLEREILRSRRDRAKEATLTNLKNKLQQCSMGEKPFQSLRVSI
jgi:hypothetical protein